MLLANYTTHTPTLTVLRTHTYPRPYLSLFSAKTVIFKTVHLIELNGVQLYMLTSGKGYFLAFLSFSLSAAW